MIYFDFYGLLKVLRFGGTRETHSSLLLDDGTYISTYPIGDWIGNTSLQGYDKYDKIRVQDELKDALSIYEIKNLDEDKIKKWWNKNKDIKNYNIITNNCSSVVYDALAEGDNWKLNIFLNKTTPSIPLLSLEVDLYKARLLNDVTKIK